MAEAPTKHKVRADKWLWAVRLYKSRSLAAAACHGGKIKKAGKNCKPSTLLKVGDIVEVSTPLYPRTLSVVELIERRVGAPIAACCYEDLTDPELVAKAKAEHKNRQGERRRGLGRPTKHDRRDIEQMKRLFETLPDHPTNQENHGSSPDP